MDRPLPTPAESEERKVFRGWGRPFLWELSFGRAKESSSAVGPRTHIQNPVIAQRFKTRSAMPLCR
ncbi:MAG: hypothetical protein FIA97_08205 [Methylococcaceae bacterium]|nr:hypothetical protein [Methylococcaceae bacterium]